MSPGHPLLVACISLVMERVDWGEPGFADTQITKNLLQLLAPASTADSELLYLRNYPQECKASQLSNSTDTNAPTA